MKLWVSIIIFIMALFFLIIVNKINKKNKKLNIAVNILSISVMVLCLLYIILTLILVDSKKYDQDSKYTDKAIEIAKSLINLGLDKEAISKSTGLDLCEVEKLMN